MKLVRACAEDAHTLTEIAIAAKSHWGYPPSWIRRWQEALTVTPHYVIGHPTYAAVLEGRVVGFYVLEFEGVDALLEHLWVLPPFMGRGVGRALFEHAELVARGGGAVRLRMEGDPHAEKFYTRMGATVYGWEPADMDGQKRFLPLLEKAL